MIIIISTELLGSTSVPLAFPGAHGFGAISSGGRGGDVYHVTTLADGGPGSLREGIATAANARTIVFEIGGTIDLESTLVIKASKLTIAGQTAPGGIGVRGYPTRIQNAEDIVIRYMRFRTGDINAAPVPLDKPVGNGNADLLGDAADALSVTDSNSVIIDHCSASWGMDETLSVTRSNNVTVQHSIVSEGLQDSFYPEGSHSQGSLLRGQGGDGGYTFFGNIYAHNWLRNPAFGGEDDPISSTPRAGLDLDFDNNVIYNWGLAPVHTVSGQGRVRVNFRSNVLIAGPSTVLCQQCAFVYVDRQDDDELSIYQNGNLFDFNQDGVLSLFPVSELSFIDDDEMPLTMTLVDQPFDFPRRSPKVWPARVAFLKAILRAGASLSRDKIDWRIILEVLKQSGGIIDSQDEVGGWPLYHSQRAAPVDLDRDGMADEWECCRGLDSADVDDRNGFDLNPIFTNLEVYLHFQTRLFTKLRDSYTCDCEL